MSQAAPKEPEEAPNSAGEATSEDASHFLTFSSLVGADAMTRSSSRPVCLLFSLCAVLSVLLAAPLLAHAQEVEEGPEERAAVQDALEQYMEGLIAQDAGRIPLASEVIFVEPDGATETTLEGISEVGPFLERQTVDSIRVHRTVIDGEWGCELTDYFWSGGPKMPIALCLRVEEGKITEIRPYFDRSLFGD